MTRRFDPSDIPEAPDLRFERILWEQGVGAVAGLDEAGRGAWAGPVAAGAVILPPDPSIAASLNHVRDSKQMTPSSRDFWAQVIRQRALAWAVGFASSQEIDLLGIIAATRQAMVRALENLPIAPAHLLIDALILPEVHLPQTALIKGDARSLSIAAASVLAKTARDAVMAEMGEKYPDYGFGRHKGYGTALHAQMLLSLGPCPLHRTCFEPVRHMLEEK